MNRTADCNLSYDPVHGYVPFTSGRGLDSGEISERQIIDHPWIQRLRHIHQLQTAWWVFPSAEHTRFQHVLGVMHLGSRFIAATYESLVESCSAQGEPVPSFGYVESLLRMGGLMHDVGHGPFGHFFDDRFLRDFDLTHEILGAQIIERELGPLIRGLRRTPHAALDAGEQLDPKQVAWLIQRPKDRQHDATQPLWLRLLRGLLSGIYTIDNMDFVLRDAYMSGYSQRSYDLDRLLNYSFFTPQGVTIHDKGIDALVRFMTARSELFSTIYFHRTVRAIDLTLIDLFADSKDFLFPGNPLENLRRYRDFTESSLLVDVRRWSDSDDARQRELGVRWQALLDRQIPWEMVCQRNLVFEERDSEASSIFSDSELVEQRLRRELGAGFDEIPLRVDIARHVHRPLTHGPAENQNFLFDSARRKVRPLTDSQVFRRLPISQRICRVYSERDRDFHQIAQALDKLIGPSAIDDLTNM